MQPNNILSTKTSNKLIAKLVYSIAIIYLLNSIAGCMPKPTAPKYPTTLEVIKPELKQGFDPEKIRPFTKIPNSVANLLLPKINNMELNNALETNQSQQRFNIIADNAPAKPFFLDLVDGTPVNLVVHPEVQGTISLSLKNVTVQGVLEAVQKIYGFGFESSAQSIKILPATLQTRVFKLNYLDLIRTGSSGTKISGIDFSSDEEEDEEESSEGGITAGSNVGTTNKTNVWQQLLVTLKSMLGIKEDLAGEEPTENSGKAVAISPITGMIIVTAYPNELEKIAQFLTTAEETLNKQVMLEAKVLEVNLNDGYRSGINWAVLNDHMKLSQIGKGANESAELSTSTIGNSVSTQDTTTYDLSVNPEKYVAPNVPISGPSFGGLLTLGLNYRKLAAFVELLSAQGNVQVLSSPRITTSNNQKALIKVGNDKFFITDYTTNSSTSAAGAVTFSPSVSLTPFFSGISLDVTPQISDEDITLHIHPTVSIVNGEATRMPSIAGQEFDLKLATSSIRESDSIVRAKNGQLIIIGGLMQDKTAEIISGVPFFKDLPFFGAAFRHTRQQAIKSELVILLRPTILDDYKTKHKLQDTYQRINLLDQGFHFGGGEKWYGTLGESQ
jgi:MSHA biogenesis protein MshL